MHPRSYHIQPYDLQALCNKVPALKGFLKESPKRDLTIDFSEPAAVIALNKALLLKHYDITYWSIPDSYLCPPVPGRAEYIHHIADALGKPRGKLPYSNSFTCMDVGVGANCIYPIIGSKVYGWQFVGTDIDEKAIESARRITSENTRLNGHVTLRLQKNPDMIFKNIWNKDEYIDLVICNPPFHESQKTAEKDTRRKLKHVTKSSNPPLKRNAGGQGRELWCQGGERAFISRMIKESKEYGILCYMFSSLISKEKNVIPLQNLAKSNGAKSLGVLEMSIGNKKSRIITWSYLTEKQKRVWEKTRWV